MRRIILALCLIVGISLFSMPTVDACGDKTLRIGRGARFKRAARPAAVLIYVPTNALATGAAKAARLQAFLNKAGHRAAVVQGAERLRDLLNSGPCDLVLSTLAEVDGLQKEIGASPTKPVVVPVIYKETKAEVTAAQRQYRYIVKDANSGDQYLEAIEEVLRSRLRVLQKKA